MFRTLPADLSSDTVDLRARADRLARLCAHSHIVRQHPLLSVLSISPTQRKKLEHMVRQYLLECLQAAYPSQDFPNDDILLTQSADLIMALPNLTPNGLLLPKSECLAGFNALQRVAVEAFEALNLLPHLRRLQYPINLRIQSGATVMQHHSRPRASSVIHSDVWAGDPACGLLVFLSILGDVSACDVEFFHTHSYPRTLLRPLENYHDAASYFSSPLPTLDRLDTSGWFVVDPLVLHQTQAHHAGLRISLDFRIVPVESCDSDTPESSERAPYFLSVEEWHGMGNLWRVHTNETLTSPYTASPYTSGYPVSITRMLA